jgi:putative proteasome-type protease
MTYCLGMLLDAGLVMMADTRTNAGIDNFSLFRKLHALEDGPDRQIFLCTAGSLSISQSVISMIEEDQVDGEPGRRGRSLKDATTMFQVAQHVGDAVQRANETAGAALVRAQIDGSVSLLLGGRTAEGPLRLFLIYNEGNFIECTAEVPFLQVGETKYGRPILDRALSFDTPLDEALKIGFLSFDSTMKSNLGVALPIDTVIIPRARHEPPILRRIEPNDRYFNEITRLWARCLKEAMHGMPNPPWMTDGEREEPDAVYRELKSGGIA